MEKNWIKFFKQCVGLLIAMNLCGIAVTLFVRANLGSDSITVIQEGISVTFGLSLGSASRVMNLVFLGIAFCVARKDIGWVTIAYALFVGYFIDVYGNLMANIDFENMHLLIRLLLIGIGQIGFIVTFSLLIVIRSGMNQIDAVSYAIERFTKIPYKIIRTGFDVLFIVVGYFMGGVVGIGSILTMLTTGYGIDCCLKMMRYQR